MRTTTFAMVGPSVLALGLLASPAAAADLPVKARPAPAPVYVPYNWSGFYVGANIGGAWTHNELFDSLSGVSVSDNNSGFIGGGQVGFNWQINNGLFGANWVLGVEWDIDGTTIDRTFGPVATPFGTFEASTNIDWITTLTGRLGLAFDRWLVYAKGGGAWVRDTATVTNLTTGVSVSASDTASGWTAGGGVEWAFAPQWSAKLEYDFVQLDDRTFTGPFVNDQITLTRDINMVKFGINYRFGWGGY